MPHFSFVIMKQKSKYNHLNRVEVLLHFGKKKYTLLNVDKSEESQYNERI